MLELLTAVVFAPVTPIIVSVALAFYCMDNIPTLRSVTTWWSVGAVVGVFYTLSALLALFGYALLSTVVFCIGAVFGLYLAIKCIRHKTSEV